MIKTEALTIQVHNQQLGSVTFYLHRTTPIKLSMDTYARRYDTEPSSFTFAFNDECLSVHDKPQSKGNTIIVELYYW